MTARRVLLGTAVVTIVCAVFGLRYSAQSLAVSLAGGFADLVREHGMTQFSAAFYTMSAICVACDAALLVGGVLLVRGRLSVCGLLVGVWIVEIVYFFAVGALWLVDERGASVAGATGVANGGMMAQFVILRPI